MDDEADAARGALVLRIVEALRAWRPIGALTLIAVVLHRRTPG
jgi:hypothetical protein